ncbi:MAG: hypothetical protein HIU84_00455 [Acidobacteria bacterium]|nr:hypothetical protein [Acidobacteriota bacterium]
MYRKSKFRLVPRVGGNALIALIALGSGVAITNAVSHQSHVTTSSTPSAHATSGSVTTTAGAVATSQPSTSATLISAPTPHVSAVAGTVTSLSGSSVSIRSRSGATLTYGLNSSTIVMRGRTRTTLASVNVATSVYVMPSTSSPTMAAAIGIIPAALGAEPPEGGSNGSDGN